MIEKQLRTQIISKLIESVVSVECFKSTPCKPILYCAGGTSFTVFEYGNLARTITINNKDVGETVFEIDCDEYNEIRKTHDKFYKEAVDTKTRENIELLLRKISL